MINANNTTCFETPVNSKITDSLLEPPGKKTSGSNLPLLSEIASFSTLPTLRASAALRGGGMGIFWN